LITPRRFATLVAATALAGNAAILIGEYETRAEDHSGGLVLFNLETEALKVVFRGGEAAALDRFP
jgi:hypothetical protein